MINAHLKLGADVGLLQEDRSFLGHFKIPGAEHTHSQASLRQQTPTQGLGHTRGARRASETITYLSMLTTDSKWNKRANRFMTFISVNSCPIVNYDNQEIESGHDHTSIPWSPNKKRFRLFSVRLNVIGEMSLYYVPHCQGGILCVFGL